MWGVEDSLGPAVSNEGRKSQRETGTAISEVNYFYNTLKALFYYGPGFFEQNC